MLHFFAKRMREIHEKDEQGQKGFTLIELLVVIIIISILSAIAIPAFLAQRDRAEKATLRSDLRNAGTAYNSCITTTDLYGSCDTAGELGTYGLRLSDGVALPDSGFAQVGGATGKDVVITATYSGHTGTYTSATGRVLVP